MTTLDDFAGLVGPAAGLCVVSTLRADSTIQSSLVNAGVLDHPTTGQKVVGLVAAGGSRKLVHLRARPQISVVIHASYRWVSAEGTAELAGPDDVLAGIDTERRRLLFREVFTAAGGTHDDWDAFDRAMAAERRAVVLVTPSRIYSNG